MSQAAKSGMKLKHPFRQARICKNGSPSWRPSGWRFDSRAKSNDHGLAVV
jgi:hypothetical protein